MMPDNLFPVNSPDQSPRQAQNTLTIHKINYGNQTTYLVTEPGGVQTDLTAPFFDSASGVHIQLTSVQGTPSTATVKVTVESTKSNLDEYCHIGSTAGLNQLRRNG